MSQFSLSKITFPHFLAVIYLLMMLTQIVWIEGEGISPLKVTLMALAIPLLLFKYMKLGEHVLLTILYLIVVLLCAYSQSYVRSSTIGFLGMNIITFLLFYNLVYYFHGFTLTQFIKFLRIYIIVAGVTVLLQQLCLSVGLSNVPFINLAGQHFLGTDKYPGWTLEPSHNARITGCVMLAYLKCISMRGGCKLTLKDMMNKEHRLVTLAFLWMILTQGSGTGFIIFFILIFFFLRKNTIWMFIPVAVLGFIVLSALHIEQFERALSVIKVTMSGDTTAVVEADDSAAARINPILNTIFNTDFLDPQMWFGHGTDSLEEMKDWKERLFTSRIGNINQYGIIGFLFSLILVFRCMISRFFSLETLIFFLILGGGINNIAYVWGCLMLFTVTKYFESKH